MLKQRHRFLARWARDGWRRAAVPRAPRVGGKDVVKKEPFASGCLMFEPVGVGPGGDCGGRDRWLHRLAQVLCNLCARPTNHHPGHHYRVGLHTRRHSFSCNQFGRFFACLHWVQHHRLRLLQGKFMLIQVSSCGLTYPKTATHAATFQAACCACSLSSSASLRSSSS